MSMLFAGGSLLSLEIGTKPLRRRERTDVTVGAKNLHEFAAQRELFLRRASVPDGPTAATGSALAGLRANHLFRRSNSGSFGEFTQAPFKGREAALACVTLSSPLL